MTTAINFNLSKIMKAAHTIRVKDGVNMSQALRKAWAWAKKKAAQYLAAQSGMTCQVSEFVDETDAAIKVQLPVHFTWVTGAQLSGSRVHPNDKGYKVNVWIPKSQILSSTEKSITIPGWLYEAKGRAMEKTMKGSVEKDNIRPALA